MTHTDEIPDIFRESMAKANKTETDIMAQKAAAVISGLTEQYITQVKLDLVILKQTLEKARQSKPDMYFSVIHDIFSFKMHDLKGQGSTFGYPLLTEIGAYACDYLRHKKEITPTDLEKLTQLVGDIDKILTQNLTGTDGEVCSEIRSHLIAPET